MMRAAISVVLLGAAYGAPQNSMETKAEAASATAKLLGAAYGAPQNFMETKGETVAATFKQGDIVETPIGIATVLNVVYNGDLQVQRGPSTQIFKPSEVGMMKPKDFCFEKDDGKLAGMYKAYGLQSPVAGAGVTPQDIDVFQKYFEDFLKHQYQVTVTLSTKQVYIEMSDKGIIVACSKAFILSTETESHSPMFGLSALVIASLVATAYVSGIATAFMLKGRAVSQREYFVLEA